MQRTIKLGAFAVLLGLAACGDTFGERALIGGGAGAATAVVLEEDVATGALIGAAGNVAFCELRPQDCR